MVEQGGPGRLGLGGLTSDNDNHWVKSEHIPEIPLGFGANTHRRDLNE